MSYSFEARISPTSLSFAETLEHLDECFLATGLEFTGEVTRLHSRSGVPTVKSFSPHEVSTVGEVAEAAKKWWGVSMLCNSASLREELGRNTAIEVDVAVFPGPGDVHLVTYTEPKGAFWARVRAPALETSLGGMLAAMCAELEATCAIYAEESEEETLVIPDVDEVRQRLASAASMDRAPGFLAVVSQDELGFEEARELAVGRSELVRVSTGGYVVIPFLSAKR